MLPSIRFLLVIFGLGLSLVTCKRGPENSSPEPLPKVDPRILTLHLEGVPDQNIQIDQEKREITIILPNLFKTRRPKASFAVTTGSQVLYKMGERYWPDVDGIDLGDMREDIRLAAVATENVAEKIPASQVTDYRLILVQLGKLAIRLLPEEPLNTYTIGDQDGFTFVADNFYDGNEYGAQLTLVPKENSGIEPVVIRSNKTAQYISDADGTSTAYPTQVRVRIPEDAVLLPGEYKLELQKADGRSAVSTDLLVVKKGTMRLGKDPDYVLPQRSLNGSEVTLEGRNLFENPVLEVEFRHPNGTVWRRIPRRFSRSGTELTVAPGNDAKPGHYLVRLLENNQPVSPCYRLAVVRTAEQPSITGLELLNSLSTLSANDFCNFGQPLLVVRNTADGGQLRLLLRTTPLAGTNIQTRLKLVSVAQPQSVIEMPFQVEVYSRAVLDYYHANLKFPEDLPAGQYRLSVLVTNIQTNRTQESEPFERTIDLR